LFLRIFNVGQQYKQWLSWKYKFKKTYIKKHTIGFVNNNIYKLIWPIFSENITRYFIKNYKGNNKLLFKSFTRYNQIRDYEKYTKKKIKKYYIKNLGGLVVWGNYKNNYIFVYKKYGLLLNVYCLKYSENQFYYDEYTYSSKEKNELIIPVGNILLIFPYQAGGSYNNIINCIGNLMSIYWKFGYSSTKTKTIHLVKLHLIKIKQLNGLSRGFNEEIFINNYYEHFDKNPGYYYYIISSIFMQILKNKVNLKLHNLKVINSNNNWLNRTVDTDRTISNKVYDNILGSSNKENKYLLLTLRANFNYINNYKQRIKKINIYRKLINQYYLQLKANLSGKKKGYKPGSIKDLIKFYHIIGLQEERFLMNSWWPRYYYYKVHGKKNIALKVRWKNNLHNIRSNVLPSFISRIIFRVKKRLFIINIILKRIIKDIYNYKLTLHYIYWHSKKLFLLKNNFSVFSFIYKKSYKWNWSILNINNKNLIKTRNTSRDINKKILKNLKKNTKFEKIN